MEGDRSDYEIFSDLGQQHSSRYSRCSWLRERLATRDFGYCLVLAVTTIALLALISANRDKATRLTDLEGKVLELANSSTNLTVLEGRVKALEQNSSAQLVNNTTNSTKELETVKTRLEDLSQKISNNTQELTSLGSKIENNAQALEKLQGSGQKNETSADTGAKVVDERKNDTGSNRDLKNVTTKAPAAGRR